MITTDDKSLAEKIRMLRDHGAAMTDLQRHLGNRPYLLYDHPEAGYNQRITDIQAALGSAQMDLMHRRLFLRGKISLKDLMKLLLI